MVKNESLRDQMFAMIGSWKQSGLSQKAWCRQQDIAYYIFHYWYGQYRKEQIQPETSHDFISLSVKPETAPSACEVVYADGTRVVFHQPVSVSYLKSLLF